MKSAFKIPQELASDRFPSLDGIRAICIILVLFAHILSPYKFNEHTHFLIELSGVLGVQVFFVISGFLITTLLLKEKINKGDISLKNFYTRRVLRIFPVAFLYLICILALNFILGLQIPAKCFIGAAFFMSNLAWFQGSWYTGHYWSLSIEEQYYLVFPLMMKKFTDRIHLLLIAVLSFIIFLRALAYSGNFPDWPVLKITGYLIYQSDGVLMGSLLAVLCFKNYVPINFFRRFSIYFILLLPVLIWSFHANLIGITSVNPTISSLLISIVVLCCVVSLRYSIYNFLNNKYIMLVGKLSFSIYIWQQLFTGYNDKMGRLARVPVNLIMIALVSYCSYYFFEKKFLKLKDKFY
jgi:peptidoglycan/LPS O-acetylase OafA/YrhL